MKRKWRRISGRPCMHTCQKTDSVDETGSLYKLEIDGNEDGRQIWSDLVALYKQIRMLSNLTQSQVAAMCGLDVGVVQKLENDECDADLFAADRIFRSVGMELYLGGPSDNKMISLSEFIQASAARWNKRGS